MNSIKKTASKVMRIFGPLVGLNELVLAIWLISRGFNTAAAVSAGINGIR